MSLSKPCVRLADQHGVRHENQSHSGARSQGLIPNRELGDDESRHAALVVAMCYPHFFTPYSVHGYIDGKKKDQDGAVKEEELPALTVLRASEELA